MKCLLEELPQNSEDTHKLSCPEGEITFDWSEPKSIWITGIQSKKENQGTARALLNKIYEMAAGGTVHLGTIVAHPAAAAGLIRIQERFSKKYNVKIGQFRLDPTPKQNQEP